MWNLPERWPTRSVIPSPPVASRRKNIALLGYMAALFLATAASAELVVIASAKSAARELSLEEVQRAWIDLDLVIGKIKFEVMDREPGTQAYERFYQVALAKSARQVRAIRTRQAFEDAKLPPRTVANDEAVVAWVVDKPHRLGYVDEGAVDSSVKIVFRLGDVEAEKP